MANWIYNLLHGKLPGKGLLGRSSAGSGPGELLDPAAARALLGSSGRDFATVAAARAAVFTEGEHCSILETNSIYLFSETVDFADDGKHYIEPTGGGLLTTVDVRNAEAIDSLTSGQAIDRLVVTDGVSAGVWTVTVTQPEGRRIRINIGGDELTHTSSVMSVNATSFAGTDSNPNDVYIYIKNTAGAPELVASNTSPEGFIPHVDCELFVAGSVSTDSMTQWGSMDEPASAYEFNTNIYHSAYEAGVTRRSGMSFAATQTTLSIASGQVRQVFAILSTDAVSVAGGFLYINNDGTFATKNDFSFTNYSTGEAISSNKYYCVTFGIVVGSNTRLHAIVSAKPPSEHESAIAAYNDESGARVYASSRERLNQMFIPVCFVVVKRDTDNYLQEVAGAYAHQVTQEGGGAVGVSNVNNGTAQNDIPAYNLATGKYDPKTPAEVRALLGSSGRDFATVAEAEAATYTEPEYCVVKETALTYQYDSNSTATRDGKFVLDTGGAGRLVAIGGVVYDSVTGKIFFGANIDIFGGNGGQINLDTDQNYTGVNFKKDGTRQAALELQAGSGFNLTTTTTIPLRFYTDDTLALIVDENQNAGFGTTVPTARTHIKGSTADSSSFVKKDEDSTGKLLESLRADGLKFHDGAIARPALTITADTTLTVATRAFLIFNFAGTGGVVTLPASPEDGQEFHPENTGAFSVTLARNGKLINGAASNISIGSQSNGYYKYDNASGSWWSFD